MLSVLPLPQTLLNAKDDSVFVFAKKSIGLSSAGSIHFNSDDVMIINSPKIYLGLNAMDYAVLHLRYELASILA